MFKFQNQAFTLVELLVVIAIIGILSSVAVVNLNSARDKARVAAIEQTLSSLLPVAHLCLDDGENLQVNGAGDCNGTQAPTEPYEGVCASSSTLWPNVANQSGWYWDVCDSNKDEGTFSYSATNDTDTVTCDQNSCTTS